MMHIHANEKKKLKDMQATMIFHNINPFEFYVIYKQTQVELYCSHPRVLLFWKDFQALIGQVMSIRANISLYFYLFIMIYYISLYFKREMV